MLEELKERVFRANLDLVRHNLVIFRPIAQIAGWNVPLSLMYTSDLSDSNV